VKGRRWALALVALAACSSPPPATATARYQPEDLRGIELAPSDAPSGLSYVPAFSGDQDLDAFARDAGEKAALTADGFELGSGSLFVPSDRAGGGHLTPADPIVQGTVAVFAREDGASSSLTRYLTDLRERQFTGAHDRDAVALGDEAYGMDATNSDGAPVTVLAWRRANLVMVVIGTAFPPPSVEALARLVDGRAAGIAR
jgi:hypothetical protein